MRISKPGLNFIAKFEGFSATVYPDAAGYPTIGYGHLIKEGESFTSITHDEAISLLARDAKIAISAVQRMIYSPLTQAQFDMLVSFAFNLGSGALQRSTLRMRVNRGDHEGAAYEFTKWVYAGGRKLRGLIRRRNAEADVYLGLQHSYYREDKYEV